MSKQLYFEKPTQVRFWESAELDYVGGIAYRDEIICGCCGCTLSIEEIYEHAECDRENGDNAPAEEDVIQELSWISINVEIAGEDPWPRDPAETTTEPPYPH